MINTYKRFRKSLIENKIFKLIKEINTLAQQSQDIPNTKVDLMERRKSILIQEYKKYE